MTEKLTGAGNTEHFRRLVEMVEKMSPMDKSIASLEAVSIEELRDERTAMEILCAQGVRTGLKALNQGRPQQRVAANDADKSRILGQGNTYTIDTSGIKPEFIPTTQWQKTRREILDRNMSSAAKAL